MHMVGFCCDFLSCNQVGGVLRDFFINVYCIQKGVEYCNLGALWARNGILMGLKI